MASYTRRGSPRPRIFRFLSLSLSFILGSTLNKLRVSPAHWRQMPNSGPPSQNWPPVCTRVHTLSLSFILGSTLNKLRVSPAHWRQMPNGGPPSQNWPPVYTRVHTPASATPRGLGCSRDATVIPHAASRQAIRARCTAGTMSSTLQAWSFP